MSDAAVVKSGPTWPLALVIALAIGGAALLVVVGLAFSTHNTPSSINGHTAVHSHWIEGS